MGNYVITTDSTTDLPMEQYDKNNIGLLSLNYIFGDVIKPGTPDFDAKDFYDRIRSGQMPTTSQVNPAAATEFMKAYLQKGYDILHIAFSSALSGSYNNCYVAAEELREEFPDRKIIVIDSLCASLGEGLLVYLAAQKKADGLSLEELADWIEQNKMSICHVFTVDDLKHLFRGGRVSRIEAFAGTLMNIKPILHVDTEGRLIPVAKVRGRKSSLKTLVDRMEHQVGKKQNNIIFISHSDAQEDAEYVARLIRERFGIESFLINMIGPVIGSHTGPGTIALFFIGETR